MGDHIVYEKVDTKDSSVNNNNAGSPDSVEEFVYRRIIIVTLSMFMGYAILVSFQRHIKEAMNIPEEQDDPRNIEFTFAVSFLYIGNLVFRLAHNFVFFCLKPRQRVYIAMSML